MALAFGAFGVPAVAVHRLALQHLHAAVALAVAGLLHHPVAFTIFAMQVGLDLGSLVEALRATLSVVSEGLCPSESCYERSGEEEGEGFHEVPLSVRGLRTWP
jgi:hypothetical protein